MRTAPMFVGLIMCFVPLGLGCGDDDSPDRDAAVVMDAALPDVMIDAPLDAFVPMDVNPLLKREALANVERLYQGAITYWTTHGQQIHQTAGAMTPSSYACAGRTPQHHQPNSALWLGTVYDDLGFEMTEPHLYAYQYVPGATSFSAIAMGDLDCDGIPGSFTISASFAGGQATRVGTIEHLPDE